MSLDKNNDNEEYEEEDAETIAKFKRIKEKSEAHMIDIAQEFLDDEAKERLEKKIKKVFASNSIPMNTMTLSAFHEGATLGMAAYSQDKDGQLPFMIIAFTKMMIEARKKDISKLADDAMREKNDGK